jgi:hypothetical protein
VREKREGEEDLDRRRENELQWAETRDRNKELLQALDLRRASEMVGLDNAPTPAMRQPAKNKTTPAGPPRRSGRHAHKSSTSVDVEMTDSPGDVAPNIDMGNSEETPAGTHPDMPPSSTDTPNGSRPALRPAWRGAAAPPH